MEVKYMKVRYVQVGNLPIYSHTSVNFNPDVTEVVLAKTTKSIRNLSYKS